MGRKKTIKEVQNIIEELDYEWVDGEYKNNKSKLILRDKDGYMYSSYLNNLLSKRLPFKFHEKNQFTIQNIKLWLKLNNKSVELISESYIKKNLNLIWKCLICGDEFPMRWDCMRYSQGESVSHGTQRDSPCFPINKKYTYQEVKILIESLGFELVSKEYKDANKKLILKDKYGYYYESCLSGLIKNQIPMPINKYNSYTIQNIKHWIEKENKIYSLISETYENSLIKLTFKYNEGYLFEALIDNLMIGGDMPDIVSKYNIYSIENIQLYLKLNNPKYELVSDKYIGAQEELILKDNEGYYYNTNWGLLQSKRFPLRFYFTNPYTIQNVHNWIKINKKQFVLIDDKYIEITEKLKFKCTKDGCGEIFESRLTDILRGDNCPYCRGLRVCLSNCLATINPKLASEWHISLNEGLTPYDVVSNSGIYAWWECNDCKYVWYASVANRNFNESGCPMCAYENRLGENNWNWKGGISPISNYLRGQLIDWKKESMKQCKYKCVITGDRFDEIHHVYGFDSIIRETFEITKLPLKNIIADYSREELNLLTNICLELHNKYLLGVCLRKDMHELFHKEYGYGNNTISQFQEFKEKQIKIASLFII